MNKVLNKFISLTLLFSLCGCDNNINSSLTNSTSNNVSNFISNSINSSSNTPSTEIEKAFYKLKNNNFTIDFYDSLYDNQNILRNEKYYYTDYALQAEGDFGFSGIAQGDDLIFKYTLEDGEVVSGAPIIDSNYGTRFESIFDFTYGMQDFDYRDLPSEIDEKGYYTYTFGKNKKNDSIILPVFLRMGQNSLPPEELKIKIVKDVITFEAIILNYDFDGDGINEGQDTMSAIVYDIGKTENPEIKKYLSDGKTSKAPLDLRFYKLFHPYLSSQNYTVDLDATGMNYDFKMTEYCTKNAVLDVVGNSNSGYMINQGAVTGFTIKDNKVHLSSTLADSDGQFYDEIYGQVLAYTFESIYYDSLIGYKDDENDNVYYLTDTYLIYVLSYLCYNEVYETNYCDKVKLEIINDETHEFKLYFEMYNKQTNRDLGIFEARFYDLNNTSIPAVEEYLYLGDNPNTQTKQNLENVLNMFKEHNYSYDVLMSAGMAKYYNTSNYFYVEVYGSPNKNFGYLKLTDGVYEFTVVDNVLSLGNKTDYILPSAGQYFGDIDDLGFVSSINEGMFNIDNYTSSSIYNEDYWKITDISVANNIFNYFLGYYDDILPSGTGVIVKDDGEDSKLTIFTSYISMDGEYYGYTTFTYYDIGSTSHPVIEEYLSNI